MIGLISAVAFLLGDIVYLADGTKVEGEVTRKGGRVTIRMRSGVAVSYPEKEVVRIVSSSSEVGEYRKKCASLSDWDARGWLRLGEWCLGREMEKEARECFEKASSTASEHLPEAARKLAALLEKAGELRRAADLYGMLETSFSDAGARRKRMSVQKKLVARFRKDLWAAQSALAEGNVLKAVGIVGTSREAWPSGAEEEAIRVLREIRRAEEEKLRGLAAPVCGVCSAAGLMTCPGCGGEKKVKTFKQFITMEGIKTRKVIATCGRCKGKGKLRCTGCLGSGYDMSANEPSHRRAAQEFFRVCHTYAGRPPQLGIPALHKRLADIATRLPPGLEPRYGGSRALRAAVGSVPFGKAPAAMTSQWRLVPRREKEQFFRAYALETVELIKAFPPETPIPGSGEELARMSEPADDAFLHAAEEGPRWVSFTMDLANAKKSFESALLCIWRLPSGLAFYAWKPQSEAICGVLVDILGSKTIARRSLCYDYGLADKVRALEGQSVRVRGLFHRCPLSIPSARVEVWHIEARPDEQMEMMLATGRKEVTFRFDGTPLKDALALLSALTRAPIRTELPPDAELQVTLSARKEPLAVAVDMLARAAKVPWGFEGKGMVVGRAGDAERTKKVLQLLGGE